jgi:CRISPR/Cas system-associated endonuclease Cas1
MNTKFDDLVRSLDERMLEELRRSVTTEVNTRREQTAIQIEQIHPKMSAAAREEAAREIARALRGEESNA